MVRIALLPSGFHLFHRIVEKEVDKDGIDL